MSDLANWRQQQPPPKSRRHRAGVCHPYMSQAEAAKYFGVSVSTFRAWERGLRAMPPYVRDEVKP